MEINELLKIKYSQMAQTITWIERRIKGHAANCDKVQCLQHLTHCRNLKQNIVAEQMDVKAKSNIMNWWLHHMLTVGLQITISQFDDAPTNTSKGNQRQRRDQSYWQRQRRSLLLALMINSLPPATSLAMAPEASLEASELKHCLIVALVWDREERGHKLLLLPFQPFHFPETPPQHSQRTNRPWGK